MTQARLICAAAIALMAIAAPARAQSVPDLPDDIDLGQDRVTIGIGPAVIPSYSGSRHSVVVPSAAIQGRVSGLAFETQGTSLSVNLIPDHGKPGWTLQAGPQAALRLDRTGRIGNPAVEALGKRHKAWELGGWIGIQKTGVMTSPYDSLSFSTSYQADIGNAHKSYVISPSIDYATPLSHKLYASLSISADYVGKGFGRYYYDVDAAGSQASDLPAYAGADRGGWKDWNTGLLAAWSLTGDLTHGVKLYAAANYTHILGAYRRSPIVDLVGDPGQWSGSIGIAYTF